MPCTRTLTFPACRSRGPMTNKAWFTSGFPSWHSVRSSWSFKQDAGSICVLKLRPLANQRQQLLNHLFRHASMSQKLVRNSTHAPIKRVQTD